MLTVGAGLLLRLLLEGARRGVPQAQAQAVLLSRGRAGPSWGHEHGGAVLEGSGAGHCTGHPRVVRQARVTVARRQKGLLAAVVLWLALRLWLSLGGLRLTLALSLARALRGLRSGQAGGWCRGGGVVPAELCDFA